MTQLRVEYNYDAADRLTEAERYNAATSGTKIGRTLYDYDAANRLTSEERASVVTDYAYDPNSQLPNDDTTTYTYDRNGNRTMAGHTVGANNRLATDGTWDYS